GGTFAVDIQYNTDFDVVVESGAQSWITFVATRALKSGKLEFRFAENQNTDPRQGKVTVKDKSGKVSDITLTFVQEEKKVINVGDVMEIPAEGGLFEIDIQYNTDFDVIIEEAAQSWITFVATRSLTSGKLQFQIAPNEISDIRKGTVTIKDKSGKVEPVTLTLKQASKVRNALMAIYNAMDGPNWTYSYSWGTDKPISSWTGVTFDEQTHELQLSFFKMGLKGEFPDCFDGLSACTYFLVNDEGVTGTLPPSFNKLKNLKELLIQHTSMTSLSDVFEGIPLETVSIAYNNDMTGPLPESLGSSGALKGLTFDENKFTGRIPDSWARLGTALWILDVNNTLDGIIPDSFYTADEAAYLINMYLHNSVFGKHFTVGDKEIPAYWPKRGLKDTVTEQMIPFREIVSKNKATVLIMWGTWCPYSKTLMPILKQMYDKYHKDGLEVIAFQQYDAAERAEIEAGKSPKDCIIERGYDCWYNFVGDLLTTPESLCWTDTGVPSARVVDKDGNILFCGVMNITDPLRNRFGYPASKNLISQLEEIFGPLEEEYTSTDFSKDGDVWTLQTATVGNGINLVLMGDAYTDRDIYEGLYDKVMRASMEQFFAIEPYKTFRNRFNVYSVKVVSKNGRTGEGYSTALGAVIANGQSISGNRNKCFEYALKVPGINDTHNLLINVLVNSTSNGGICTMIESLQTGIGFVPSIGNNQDLFGPILRHETGGHGFAFLGDEYATHPVSPTQADIDEFNRQYNEYGWLANIDFTNDPAKVKWSAFLADDRYKDEVGIFEGACNVLYNVYRPSKDSMMNQEVEYFNAPSRWAIYKRIMELSGESYSFQTFLEYDAVNRAKASQAAARPPLKAAANGRKIQHSAPPEIIK
ncbi:MAG: redoxin domain-containing protein, partial [Bacteroidales bacterium]|nr:redoxin domain-containing protein [Bacteroidales bacterium]